MELTPSAGDRFSNIGPFQRVRVIHRDIYIYIPIPIDRFGAYPKGPSGRLLDSMDLGEWKCGKYVAIGHLDPMWTSKNYNPHYGDPPKITPNLGNPRDILAQNQRFGARQSHGVFSMPSGGSTKLCLNRGLGFKV